VVKKHLANKQTNPMPGYRKNAFNIINRSKPFISRPSLKKYMYVEYII